jgi:hypothetical protein
MTLDRAAALKTIRKRFALMAYFCAVPLVLPFFCRSRGE